MPDPTTGNIALIIPATGSDVDTWGEVALNPDFVAIDGVLAGVATVAMSSTNVVLTAPTGTIAPTAGPVQTQNAVIRLVGAMSIDLSLFVTMPGRFIIENLTTGGHFVALNATTPGGGEIVAIPQGVRTQVFNDGTNVRFLNDISSFPGKMEFLGGAVSVPAWILVCTVRPYLLADGTVYNIADYPALGALYGSSFGGNGISTFAVPDMRGRVPLAYDGTGVRITVAGCGINGQTMGAAGGEQTHTLVTAELASHAHGVNDPQHHHAIDTGAANTISAALGAGPTISQPGGLINSRDAATGIGIQSTGSDFPHNNVQPAQVCGIWLVKT